MEVVQAANRRISELSREDESQAGMGTTLTAAVVDGDDVVIAHVGDSRLYRLRDGTMERLTTDHSLVELSVRQRLTPEGAERHRRSDHHRAAWAPSRTWTWRASPPAGGPATSTSSARTASRA